MLPRDALIEDDDDDKWCEIVDEDDGEELEVG